MTSDGNSSPPCSAAVAADAYMGFADTAELVSVLNTLLEAERAGARVAQESLVDARNPIERDRIGRVHRDEGHWCSMLATEIRRLGAEPSDTVGSFHAKAMAIPSLDERLRFLNRGQAWVVRRIEEILPRVRDARLHAALQDMRAGHVENIRMMSDD